MLELEFVIRNTLVGYFLGFICSLPTLLSLTYGDQGWVLKQGWEHDTYLKFEGGLGC